MYASVAAISQEIHRAVNGHEDVIAAVPVKIADHQGPFSAPRRVALRRSECAVTAAAMNNDRRLAWAHGQQVNVTVAVDVAGGDIAGFIAGGESRSGYKIQS